LSQKFRPLTALAMTLVVLGTLLLLVHGIQAVTPHDPTKGENKPSEFPARLPWVTGEQHNIDWTYGKCNRADLSQGDHCNGRDLDGDGEPDGPQDHYALDFDVDSTSDLIYPIAGGTVLYADEATDGWDNYGNIVYLDHEITQTQ